MIRKITYGVGGLILLFGLITFGMQFIIPLKTTTDWYIKVLSIISTGGAVLAIPKGMDKVSSMIVTKENNKVINSDNLAEPLKMVVTSIQLAPDIQRDYECLHHMIKRFAEISDKDGVSLCNQLQNKLFEIHSKSYEKSKDNTTS